MKPIHWWSILAFCGSLFVLSTSHPDGAQSIVLMAILFVSCTQVIPVVLWIILESSFMRNIYRMWMWICIAGGTWFIVQPTVAEHNLALFLYAVAILFAAILHWRLTIVAVACFMAGKEAGKKIFK